MDIINPQLKIDNGQLKMLDIQTQFFVVERESDKMLWIILELFPSQKETETERGGEK